MPSTEKSSLIKTAHERNIEHREDSQLTLLGNGLNNVSPTFDHYVSPVFDNSDIKCETPMLERFPHKLFAILSSGMFKNIITFSDDGKSWKVINKKLLERDVLPEYFRTGKYLSFTRNVLGWGFQRNGKATYYHELFCRGQPDKLDNMLRISASKVKSMNKKENEEKEKSESPRHSRNSSYHTISGLINRPCSDVPFSYNITQELKDNMKYFNLSQQVMHSQEHVSPYPIYNNNYFANERSNSLHTMIPQVNLASNNYREDINRPSTRYQYQLYFEGIELRDSKARMTMNRNQYIVPHNNLSSQDGTIPGRSDMYYLPPYNGCKHTNQDRGH